MKSVTHRLLCVLSSHAQCNNCPDTSDPTSGFLCQPTLMAETAVSVTNTLASDGTTTGGGFSFVFAQPAWQRTAVNAYLTQKCTSANSCRLPQSSQFNANNRAYPDVAAFGGYFGIVVNGQEASESGTSVAAPVWAGLMARLNEAFIARYNAPIGLAMPFLYNMSAVSSGTFQDITTGNNICPRSNPDCVTAVTKGGSTSCQGFQAAPGWDPVTGLGSPNIGAMLKFIQTDTVVIASTGTLVFQSTGRNGATGAASGSVVALAVCAVLAAVMQLI